MRGGGCVVWSLGALVLVWAGQDTDEELAHYVKKEPSTLEPWTSNERRINKMIEEEIIKFNYAPETTECPYDSQGNLKPPEPKEPTWWNAYRQAKDGDRPDWSAEIRELIKNPRTYPPWTPSQESEPELSKYKNIEPFTWRPGAPVINLRLKTDATTRHSSEPQETTTERSFEMPPVVWDTSEESGGGGGGGTEPPLNLAPLQKGFKEDNEYLKMKPRRRQDTSHKHLNKHNHKLSPNAHPEPDKKPPNKQKIQEKKVQMRRRKSQKSRYQNSNFARI